MKVENNIFVRGTSGQIGNQFVVRKGKGGQTIIANKPSFPQNRVFQPEQLAHQDAFKEAIAYAKTAKENPFYVALAEGTAKSAFNVAVADWFKKPQVLDIDVNGWTGVAGQVIRVKAQDDIHVASVKVVVRYNGTLIEQGEAVQAEGLWWEYTTTEPIVVDVETQVVATAKDLAGNSTDLVWQG